MRALCAHQRLVKVSHMAKRFQKRFGPAKGPAYRLNLFPTFFTSPLRGPSVFATLFNAPNDGVFNPPTFGKAAQGRAQARPLHFKEQWMKSTIVYIDGCNLYYGQLRGTTNKRT